MTSSVLDGIRVNMIYSACITIETPDCKILCDPWFTDGIFDGAWYLYSKDPDAFSAIGDCNYIYISHIHADHYDPIFLRKYFKKFGEKTLIIGDFKSNYLEKSIKSDGFKYQVNTEPLKLGQTVISIYPHETGSQSDIDSACLVEYFCENKVHRVLNINDCIFDPVFLSKFSEFGQLDILLLSYTGAGPYPQTYFELNDPELLVAAKSKKDQFIEQYLKIAEMVPSKVRIPFAGQYLLGGNLSQLNFYRGVSDLYEIGQIDSSAVVLNDYEGSIDTVSFRATGTKQSPTSVQAIEQRIEDIKHQPMVYEAIPEWMISNKVLVSLLSSAVMRARRKSECNQDYFFCFRLPEGNSAIINARKDSEAPLVITYDEFDSYMPRSEVVIDYRYLFGLLTGVFHWNNAESGSHLQVRRIPNIFSRDVQNFLNFLTV
jgi:UDP-MurNAc hydroxylase